MMMLKKAILSDSHMETVIALLHRYSNQTHVYNTKPCSLYNPCHGPDFNKIMFTYHC